MYAMEIDSVRMGKLVGRIYSIVIHTFFILNEMVSIYMIFNAPYKFCCCAQTFCSIKY